MVLLPDKLSGMLRDLLQEHVALFMPLCLTAPDLLMPAFEQTDLLTEQCCMSELLLQCLFLFSKKLQLPPVIVTLIALRMVCGTAERTGLTLFQVIGVTL